MDMERPNSRPVVLEPWLYQHPLKSLLEHRVLDLSPRVPGAVGLWWDWGICISNQPQLALLFLLWELLFENHRSPPGMGSLSLLRPFTLSFLSLEWCFHFQVVEKKNLKKRTVSQQVTIIQNLSSVSMNLKSFIGTRPCLFISERSVAALECPGRKLTHYSRHYMDCGAWNIYWLALCRKTLPRML